MQGRAFQSQTLALWSWYKRWWRLKVSNSGTICLAGIRVGQLSEPCSGRCLCSWIFPSCNSSPTASGEVEQLLRCSHIGWWRRLYYVADGETLVWPEFICVTDFPFYLLWKWVWRPSTLSPGFHRFSSSHRCFDGGKRGTKWKQRQLWRSFGVLILPWIFGWNRLVLHRAWCPAMGTVTVWALPWAWVRLYHEPVAWKCCGTSFIVWFRGMNLLPWLQDHGSKMERLLEPKEVASTVWANASVMVMPVWEAVWLPTHPTLCRAAETATALKKFWCLDPAMDLWLEQAGVAPRLATITVWALPWAWVRLYHEPVAWKCCGTCFIVWFHGINFLPWLQDHSAWQQNGTPAWAQQKNPLLGMQMKLSKLAIPKKANSPKDTSSWCLVAFWLKNVIPLNLCCNPTWLDPSKSLTSFALRHQPSWGKVLLWMRPNLVVVVFCATICISQNNSTTVKAAFAHTHSSGQWSL